jgi:hypothetical protein
MPGVELGEASGDRALQKFTLLVGDANDVRYHVQPDGGAQNSGLLSMTTNTTGEVTGAIITPHARDRYNALVAIYSTNFFPALTFDAGITPLMLPQYVIVGKPPPQQTYHIDAEHLVDFMRMNRWHRSSLGSFAPTSK